MSNQIVAVSHKGPSEGKLQALKPSPTNQTSVDSERVSLDDFALENDTKSLSTSMCTKIKAIETTQISVLTIAGVASSFKIADAGSR